MPAIQIGWAIIGGGGHISVSEQLVAFSIHSRGRVAENIYEITSSSSSSSSYRAPFTPFIILLLS